jgi:hypothetical protein
VFFFFSADLKPDLRTSVDLCLTRATQPHSPSLSAPTAGSIGRVLHRSSARGPHGPKSFCSLFALEGHAPHFQAVLGGAWGLRRWSCCLVFPVSARVLHAPPLRRSLPFLHCLWRLVFWFFSAFVLCIPFVSPVQSVSKKINFTEICVKCNSCNVYVSTLTAVFKSDPSDLEL